DKHWYLNFHAKWRSFLRSKRTAPKEAQLVYLYILRYQLLNNVNGRNKWVLRGRDLAKYFKEVARSLKYIDDENIIGGKAGVKLNTELRLFLMQLKHPRDKVSYRCSSRNISRIFK